MPEASGSMERPQGPERKPEAAEAVERQEGRESDLEEAVDDAGKAFEAEGDALAASGDAEFSRVTAGGDVAAAEIDADPDVQDARRELDQVHARGKGVVDAFKGKLAGVGAKMKRWGRAAVAGAVITGSAMSTAEAATPPDQGPKLEHVEKGKAAPDWKAVIGATEARVMDDEALRTELGEAGRKEYMDALKSFDQEQARRDVAQLAGLDVSQVSADGYKKIDVLSEKAFKVLAADEGLDQTMDAQTENDEIRLRPSRFLGADGRVDAGKVKKGAMHEFLHVMTTVERGGDGRQVRTWDGAGVPHELNEGVSELLALRVAAKEGVKIENHQAYAGGDLVAGRLLEGIVGKETLFKDYLLGKSEGIKKALDAKLGKGAAERIMKRHVATDQQGESMAMIMEMADLGVDVRGLWKEAKSEGFLDDLRMSPDGRTLTLSRDIEGKGVLSNTLHADAAPMARGLQPLRVFAFTLKPGIPYDAANAMQVGESVGRTVRMAERNRAELTAQFADLKEQYEKAARDNDAKALEKLDTPEALDGMFDEQLTGRIDGAIRESASGPDLLLPTTVFLNTRGSTAELQRAYDAAPPEGKAAARAAIEEATERAARDVAERVRQAAHPSAGTAEKPSVK